MFVETRPQRLVQIMDDVTQYRKSEAARAVRLGNSPAQGKELLLALVWQTCMKAASASSVETRSLDRREITDVMFIIVVITLACVAVGLWYTGFLTGVPSITDPAFRASVYNNIPDFIKKGARLLLFTVVKILQFVLHMLGANNVRTLLPWYRLAPATHTYWRSPN